MIGNDAAHKRNIVLSSDGGRRDPSRPAGRAARRGERLTSSRKRKNSTARDVDDYFRSSSSNSDLSFLNLNGTKVESFV